MFGHEQVGAFGEKRDSRRLRCLLYTFDLLGTKGVLSSAFMVCSHACQGTAAAILFGHTIGKDPARGILSTEQAELRQHLSAHCCSSASDHVILGFTLQS